MSNFTRKSDLLLEIDEANLLREQIGVLQKKLELVKQSGISFYKPYSKQEAFHRHGTKTNRAFFAGNRAGKSECGVAELVSFCLGYRPFFAENDPDYRSGIPQRPIKALLICADWDQVERVFTNEFGDNPGKLRRMIPVSELSGFIKGKSGYYDTVVFKNGSIIEFDTVNAFKKNPQSAESADWDVIMVDEPCPEAMFIAHSRGLSDRNGKCWFNLTSLREPWIFNQFVKVSPRDIDQSKAYEASPNHWCIFASAFDNPYNSPEGLQNFIDRLTAEERICRVNGLPMAFAGLIYSEWTQEHILTSVPPGWTDFNQPPAEYPVWIQVDPHPRTPTAVLFAVADPQDNVYLYDELFFKGTVDQLIDCIVEKIGNRPIASFQIDPSAWNVDQLSGVCLVNAFTDAGFFPSKGSKDLSGGIMMTKNALALRQSFNKDIPKWRISPYLVRFQYELARYVWTKDEKPTDIDDHIMECLRRMVIRCPVWTSDNEKHFLDKKQSIAFVGYNTTRANAFGLPIFNT
jgi:hypothetical protein